jgi:hypothetical protein
VTILDRTGLANDPAATNTFKQLHFGQRQSRITPLLPSRWDSSRLDWGCARSSVPAAACLPSPGSAAAATGMLRGRAGVSSATGRRSSLGKASGARPAGAGNSCHDLDGLITVLRRLPRAAPPPLRRAALDPRKPWHHCGAEQDSGSPLQLQLPFEALLSDAGLDAAWDWRCLRSRPAYMLCGCQSQTCVESGTTSAWFRT